MKGIKCTSNEVNAILAGDKSQIRLIGKHKDFSNEKCPHQIGDLVFVKEDFLVHRRFAKYKYYNGDFIPDNHREYLTKVSATSMPREASRITLRIKDISVERLCDISRGDCMAEGCPFSNIAKETDPKQWFKEHWNATHKKPEEKWEANCWVWKIEFEVVK